MLWGHHELSNQQVDCWIYVNRPVFRKWERTREPGSLVLPFHFLKTFRTKTGQLAAPPCYNTELMENGLKYNAPTMWNNLQEHLKLTLLLSIVEFMTFINNFEYSQIGNCFCDTWLYYFSIDVFFCSSCSVYCCLLEILSQWVLFWLNKAYYYKSNLTPRSLRCYL